MLSKSKTKYIQSLGHKKFRDEDGVFIAEGPKLVKELLLAGSKVKELFAIRKWIEENQNIPGNFEVNEITDQELEKISLLATPNQVVAIVQQYAVNEDEDVTGKLVLALDTIQDPGNLGTIIRIADWFGISQIVCSNNSADAYNPKTVQSTMGSIARVKVVYRDLYSWISQMENPRIYAAVLDGIDITKMNKIHEGILLIGNESKGISHDLLELSNVRVSIPGKGKAESLNAAVATGIILSHLS